MFWKTAGYTTLGVLTAPLWVPLTVAGVISYESAKFALRHPKATTGAVLLGGTLWYVSSHYGVALRTSVQETIVRVAESSQRHRNDELEARITAVITENEQHKQNTAQSAAEYAQRLEAMAAETRTLREQNSAYQRDREAYLAELARRNAQPSTLPQLPTPQTQRAQDGTQNGIAMTTAGFWHYQIKPGDTLSTLAVRYNGDRAAAATIAADNNIADPNRISVGQIVRLRREICTKTTAGLSEPLRSLSVGQ
jgi:nucleoid-associated protein YgaU